MDMCLSVSKYVYKVWTKIKNKSLFRNESRIIILKLNVVEIRHFNLN